MPFAGEPFAGEMSGPGNATRTGFAGAPFAGEPFAGQVVGTMTRAAEGAGWTWTGVAPVPPLAPPKPWRPGPEGGGAGGLQEQQP